jgi:hypothetical protein
MSSFASDRATEVLFAYPSVHEANSSGVTAREHSLPPAPHPIIGDLLYYATSFSASSERPLKPLFWSLGFAFSHVI